MPEQRDPGEAFSRSGGAGACRRLGATKAAEQPLFAETYAGAALAEAAAIAASRNRSIAA